jgi:hypothetical protein
MNRNKKMRANLKKQEEDHDEEAKQNHWKENSQKEA